MGNHKDKLLALRVGVTIKFSPEKLNVESSKGFHFNLKAGNLPPKKYYITLFIFSRRRWRMAITVYLFLKDVERNHLEGFNRFE